MLVNLRARSPARFPSGDFEEGAFPRRVRLAGNGETRKGRRSTDREDSRICHCECDERRGRPFFSQSPSSIMAEASPNSAQRADQDVDPKRYQSPPNRVASSWIKRCLPQPALDDET